MENSPAQEKVQKQTKEAGTDRPDQREEILKELEPGLLEKIAANKLTPPILTLILMTALFVLSFYIASRNQTVISPENFQKEPIPTAAIRLQETQEEESIKSTTSWETYTNEEYGFTFEYPQDNEGTEIVEEDNITKFFRINPNEPFETTEFPQLQISILNNETGITGVEWILQESNIATLLQSDRYSNINWVESENWLISSDSISTFGAELYAYNFYDNIIIRISTTHQRAVLEQILSTFQFTDQNVQGAATSCLEQNQNMLAEIQACEEMNEERCVELKAEFDDCIEFCQEDFPEEICVDICRPVCQST